MFVSQEYTRDLEHLPHPPRSSSTQTDLLTAHMASLRAILTSGARGGLQVTVRTQRLGRAFSIKKLQDTCKSLNFWQRRHFQSTSGIMPGTLFAELFDENRSPDSDLINLVQGAPGVRHLLLAKDVIRASTEHLLTDPRAIAEGDVMQYGPRLGSDYARASIAKFLSEGYGTPVKGAEVVVTGGATQGLALACTHFLKEGDTVFVEDPTYFIAIMMLKNDLKMNVVPVPSDENGVDVDAYEKLLEQYVGSGSGTDQKPFRALMYLIPTYNNPRGYNLPEDRCKRLVQLARKYDVLNFCDDVYNLLHFDVNTRAPPRFLTYDSPTDPDFKGHTISNGTFSKILAPGLRLGWYETSPRIVENFHKSNILWSAGCTNHYGAEVISAAIDNGLLQKNIRDMNIEYQTKVANLCALMKESFPEGVRFNHIKGGYFIWIQMPSGCKGTDVAKLALEKYKVRVMPGSSCSPQGNFQNCLRVSISYQEEDRVLEGVRRLSEAIKECLAK